MCVALLKTQLLINFCRNRTTAFLSSFGLMVNKIDRPNTTPTVRGICKFHVYFSVLLSAFFVTSFLFMKGISYCFIRRKLDPLDPKIVLRKQNNTTRNTVNRFTRKELNTNPVVLELSKEKETYTSSSRNITSIKKMRISLYKRIAFSTRANMIPVTRIYLLYL